MRHNDVYRRLMRHNDVYRRVMRHTDVYRQLMPHTDVYRLVMWYTDVCRRLMSHTDVDRSAAALSPSWSLNQRSAGGGMLPAPGGSVCRRWTVADGGKNGQNGQSAMWRSRKHGNVAYLAAQRRIVQVRLNWLILMHSFKRVQCGRSIASKLPTAAIQ